MGRFLVSWCFHSVVQNAVKEEWTFGKACCLWLPLILSSCLSFLLTLAYMPVFYCGMCWGRQQMGVSTLRLGSNERPLSWGWINLWFITHDVSISQLVTLWKPNCETYWTDSLRIVSFLCIRFHQTTDFLTSLVPFFTFMLEYSFLQ